MSSGARREAGPQLRDHRGIGVRLQLEADDGLEAPLLQLELDHVPLAEAVVGELDLGVAADAELARVLDDHAREELLGVCGDHLVQADERALGGTDPVRTRSHW